LLASKTSVRGKPAIRRLMKMNFIPSLRVRNPHPGSAGDFKSETGSKAAGESHSTLTARAASSTTIVSEISDCSIMRPFAQRATGAVSVGEKAVLVLKATNR
jgi:hypothetical protein